MQLPYVALLTSLLSPYSCLVALSINSIFFNSYVFIMYDKLRFNSAEKKKKLIEVGRITLRGAAVKL